MNFVLAQKRIYLSLDQMVGEILSLSVKITANVMLYLTDVQYFKYITQHCTDYT